MEVKQATEVRELDRLHKKVDTLYYDLAVKIGFSSSGFLILYSIAEFGDGCVQKDISERYSISPQTLSSSIRKLEKDGYLQLKRGYGRNMRLFLTPLGEQFVSRIIHPLMEAENKVFALMTPEESAMLLQLTRKYADTLADQLQNLSVPRKEDLKNENTTDGSL